MSPTAALGKPLSAAFDPPARPPAQSIRAWAYEALREHIIRLHLRPGQALSESEIGARLQASRTPVREAFIRLAEDGLLDVHAQKGSYVTRIDPARAAEARFLRATVEKAVLAEACRAFPDPVRFELAANVELQKFCRKSRTYETMFQLDNAFHALLFRGVGKERLWLHLKKFDADLDRLRMLQLSTKFDWGGIIDDHDRIARLIAARKPGPVGPLIDRHLTPVLHDALVVRYPDYFTARAAAAGIPAARGSRPGP
jgi:DNA-binding GntR family transcriptional regulator